MTCGIYAIVAPNGKRYIGSSTRIKVRWRTHRYTLNIGTHHCQALQRAAKKYGVAALRFVIVEECSRAELRAREQVHIDATPARDRYNSALIAGSLTGYTPSLASRAKQSLAMRGRPKSAETRERMAAYAKARAPEHLARLAASQTGKTASDETRAKQRAAKLGRPQTKEHVQRVQQALAGVVRKDNKTGVRGVTIVGSKWAARVKVGDKYKHLGTFADLQSATDAVRVVRQETPE
jgi:group I intron endonuclease